MIPKKPTLSLKCLYVFKLATYSIPKRMEITFKFIIDQVNPKKNFALCLRMRMCKYAISNELTDKPEQGQPIVCQYSVP